MKDYPTLDDDFTLFFGEWEISQELTKKEIFSGGLEPDRAFITDYHQLRFNMVNSPFTEVVLDTRHRVFTETISSDRETITFTWETDNANG